MDVALTVLGPVGATVDGRPVALGGPRRRALLAALVAAAGETVGAERLLDEVWAGRRTPGVGTLHFSVSTSRSALEPRRGRGEPPRVLVRRGPATRWTSHPARSTPSGSRCSRPRAPRR